MLGIEGSVSRRVCEQPTMSLCQPDDVVHLAASLLGIPLSQRLTYFSSQIIDWRI